MFLKKSKKRQHEANKQHKSMKRKLKEQQEKEYDKVPHSFVIGKGMLGSYGRQLVRDVRSVMYPYTATNLVCGRKNILKDYVHIAGPLGINNFIIITKTLLSPQLRVTRVPHGPTLHFEIKSFATMKDVTNMTRMSLSKNRSIAEVSPLLILNGFQGPQITTKQKKHLELISKMFQNMFPLLNVAKLKLPSVRRCLLLSFDHEKDMISFRHYMIRVVPVGTSRVVRKLVKVNNKKGQKKLPDLSKYQDISDFVLKPENLSDSEYELNDEEHKVAFNRYKTAKNAVRLTEIGPRMNLSLVKILEGHCEGKVLYHKYKEYTKEQMEMIERQREEKKKLKISRINKQLANIRKKELAKEDHKKKTLEGMKRAAIARGDDIGDDSDAADDEDSDGGDDLDDPDAQNDAEYFREAVGEEPSDYLFSKSQKGKENPHAKRKQLKRKAEDSAAGESRAAKKMKANKQAEKEQLYSERKKQYEQHIKRKEKKRQVKLAKKQPLYMRKQQKKDRKMARREASTKTRSAKKGSKKKSR